MRNLFLIITTLLATCVFYSCNDDDIIIDVVPVAPDSPADYEFFRDGESTVSFSGQTDRANQLDEIKDYLKEGDAGEIMEASFLKEAYRNENGDGAGFFTFSSTKQLEDKTWGPDTDVDYYGDLFEQAAIASKSETPASAGQAGLITRENSGNTILVNNTGHELTQFIEKGLMGSVFLHQIYNTYLTDVRIGDDVDNVTVVEDKNYTALEHHWDEAFGYFTAPGDFGSAWPEAREDEARFWSNYSNIVDPSTGISDRIMNAFRDGREAIVANDMETKNANKDILYTELEILAAATTIHYINQSIDQLNAGNTGELFHVLSEAYMFARALTYSPRRVIPLSELNNILNVDFGIGGNFWNVSGEGLSNAKRKLVENYPTLAAVQDEL